MLLLVMVTLWWQRRLSGMWIGDGCGVPIVQARLRLVFQLGSDWGDTLTTHKLSCTAHRNTLDTYIVYQERWCTTVIIGKTAYTNSLREFPPIWMREKHPPILNAKSSFENLTASLQYWFEWISVCTASDISIYCKVKKSVYQTSVEKIPHITSSWRGVVFWKQWHCRFQISLQICTLTEVPRPPLTRRSGDQIVNWILSGTSFRKEKGGQKLCQMVGQRLRHPGCHIWDAATFVSRILPKSRFIKRWAGYVLDKMNIIWFDSNSRWTRWFRHCYQEAFHMFSNWLQLAKKRII